MHEQQTQTEAVDKIWTLIKDIHIAMLTTADSNGSLYSRPMATQQEHFTGELFFLTRAHSGKVDEIRDNSKVNLTYVDTRKNTFVSLAARLLSVAIAPVSTSCGIPASRLGFPMAWTIRRSWC
jgi:general stress protein 26